ncbi:uncharacterized protein LTR77_004407 [Saxophila tyrrhenica]|uniref:Uncharacterized protein n=1 Tax=Saxophila tyrrhenica TaxID=1690608 RepID=A0AAV9PGL2_9PEZI|nr:hypothetical protein LTR77_004407 [Saxophila tyrrhenica]
MPSHVNQKGAFGPLRRGSIVSAWPNGKSAAHIPKTSTFWEWLLPEGVYGHPLVIVGTRNNDTIACVAVMTSFGKMGIEDNFRTPERYGLRNKYLAVNHGNTKPHSDARVLGLEHGQRLTRQSYINLDSFFEIEMSELRPWHHDYKRCLDQESVRYLQSQLSEHIEAAWGIYARPAHNGCLSPLDRWLIHPSWLGLIAPKVYHSGKPAAAATQPQRSRNHKNGDKVNKPAAKRPNSGKACASAIKAAALDPKSSVTWFKG